MWPRSFWKRLYEPAIRAAAGLGRAPELPDPDRYQHRHAHCDVLVAGGGPRRPGSRAGGSASGKRVILADEQAEWGGRCRRRSTMTAAGWVWLAELAARARTSRCCRAPPCSASTDTTMSAAERVPTICRPRTCRASACGRCAPARSSRDRRARAAAGLCRQRPARHHAGRQPARVRSTLRRRARPAAWSSRPAAIPPMRRRATCEAPASKVDASSTCARKPNVAGSADAAGARRRGADRPYHPRHGGRTRISAPYRAGRDCPARPSRSPAMRSAMRGGWTPAVHLFSQARGKLRFDDAHRCFRAGVQRASAVPRALRSQLPRRARRGAAPRGASRPVRSASPMRTAGRGSVEAFVDFQNDVTAKDIGLACAKASSRSST